MRRIAMIAAVTAAGLVLPVAPAHAATVDNGVWDDSDAYVTCTSGMNSRRCTYDVYSYGCTDAAVVGAAVASCWFHLHATLTAVPIMNAAGHVVGCTSSALSTTGYGDYDSTFDEFDHRLDDTVAVEVKDAFGDGKPGVGKFVLVDESREGTEPAWLAGGTFVSTCARNANQWDIGGAGSVTVEF